VAKVQLFKILQQAVFKVTGGCKQCSHSGQHSGRGRKLGQKIGILKEKNPFFALNKF
jgi:hypothetical protein